MTAAPLELSTTDEPDILLGAVVRGAAQLQQASTAPLRRLQVRAGETVVEVEWQPARRPVAAVDPPAAVSLGPPATPSLAEGTFHLCAPAIGTFYRAPKPGAPPFVEVGDVVTAGQQVGIIEAMKLMNPVEAERPGRVVEILVDDAGPVEHGQPLLTFTEDG